jgi:hypothetical protein
VPEITTLGSTALEEQSDLARLRIINSEIPHSSNMATGKIGSIVMINKAGHVVLSRHYDGRDSVRHLSFESSIREETELHWPLLESGAFHVAMVKQVLC